MSNITTANAGSYFIAKSMAGEYAPPPKSDWVLHFMVVIAIVGLLAAGIAKAESFEIDKVKHFGFSFSLQKGGTWLSENAFKFRELDAKIFSGATVFTLGLVKEMSDAHPDTGDIIANALGIVAASIFNLKFDF